MVREAYVSFEIAKQLKEKGFKCNCFKYINCAECIVDIPSQFLEYIPCPTLQMAMAWLREEKNIDIFPYLYHKDFEGKLTYSVRVYEHGCEIMIPRFYDEKCENVIEAALKYALEVLL